MLRKKSIYSITSVFMAVLMIVMSVSFPVGAVSDFSTSNSSITKNQRPTGALPDTRPTTLDKNSKLAVFSSKSLPSAVDLSQSVSFPPVRDQGKLNSCVAWASAYYQFGYQVAAMNSWNVINDTTKQFSPKWVYNFINSGYNSPAKLEKAYTVLSDHGDVRFSECTPTCLDTPSEYASWYLNEDALKQALKYRVVENEHLTFANTSVNTPITSYNSDCLTNMKSFINEGHILTISTDFHEWDYKTLTNQSNSILNGQKVCIKAINSDNTTKGHCMAIVGYDDTITYDLNGNGTIQNFEKGAFKLVNSYGANYGNNGFIWVMYDALNKLSNATEQNSIYRKSIFDNNAYDVISVEEFPMDLTVKITIGQNYRNRIDVDLGVSMPSDSIPENSVNTLLDTRGLYGMQNYSGTGTSIYEEATFVFDYGQLFNIYSQRMNYYVSITDALSTNNSTTVKRVELVDSTNKTVVLNTSTNIITDSTYNYIYKLGLVGDVDNNGIVNAKDATAIQKHLADIITLSSEDLLVADVNGDGNVSASDATTIQKYIADVIQLPNGKVLLLP